MRVKPLFSILTNEVFTCLPFFFFFIIFGTFLEAFGFLLGVFLGLCRLFGVMVLSLWLPLACLGCLWALSATFCGVFGSSGLSVVSGTALGPFFYPFMTLCGIIF